MSVENYSLQNTLQSIHLICSDSCCHGKECLRLLKAIWQISASAHVATAPFFLELHSVCTNIKVVLKSQLFLHFYA
jgi:hypothetical protein